MSTFVQPNTYFIGCTTIESAELHRYLKDTGQTEFWEAIQEAKNEGLSDGEILCSFYAKLCYASLVLGKNQNISKVRDIYQNILSTINSGHFSVFEHCFLNFVTTNCSRVYTHELVRHRVGTAFSQTSGRYVRADEINLIFDPILSPVKDEIKASLENIEKAYKVIEEKLALNSIKDFNIKKKLTSAMRRILPNGQANEIGFSLNLRALRHIIQMRTSQHAEWEIRLIFNQVFGLVCKRYPAIFTDAKVEEIDDLLQVTFEKEKI